jgi:PP-loop superfamily ATP-utilizing enzyme
MLRPGERADEQHQPGRAAQISAEVGAERGESDRDGDEAHDLAEQRPGLVVRDRLNGESRLVGGGLERAHVTTTATEKPRRRSAEAIPAPSTRSS